MKTKRIHSLWLFLFAADFAAIVAAYYTTFLLRFHSYWGEQFFTAVNRWLGVRRTGVLGAEFELFYLSSAARIILFLTVTLCLLYALRDLYPGRRFMRKRPVAWNVIVANVIALGLFYAYFYLRRNVWHPRSFFVTLLVLNVIFCVLLRSGVDALLAWLRSGFGIDVCRAVLAGASEEADFLQILIEEVHPHGIRIVERLRPGQGGDFDDLVSRVKRAGDERGVDMIIVAEAGLSVGQIMRLLEVADEMDASVKVFSDQMNILMTRAKIPVDTVRGVPLVHFDAPSEGRWFQAWRRLLAVALTAVVTVLALPLMAVIAVLIKLTSRGQVLFVQERIGVNR